MELAARLADGRHGQEPHPSTPSGMVPPYQKPAARKRRKKPAPKPGHAGSRRQWPPEITRRREHPPVGRCPHCGSRLAKPTERRYRLIEDIVETEPEVAEHSIPRHWCARCGKFVEPPVGLV